MVGHEQRRLIETVMQVLRIAYTSGILSKIQYESISNQMSISLEEIGYDT